MKQEIQGLRLIGKNWTFSYRHGGKARRMKLGTAPLLVPADARRAASILAGQVACGRDPGAERKAARQTLSETNKPVRDTIEKVAALYLRHAKARTRASTWRETERVFDREILPAWRGRRLSEVSKADLISASPAASVRPPAVEKARERVFLSDDELSSVWRASYGLAEYGSICRLLILTGQRRSEVANLSWAEVDMAAKVWTLPASRAKNGMQHSVPLSEQALEVLRGLCPAFETGGTNTPVSARRFFAIEGEARRGAKPGRFGRIYASRFAKIGRERHGEPWRPDRDG